MLNTQHTRVFTNENPTLPTVGQSEFPDMPDIAIDHIGVIKLLEKINPSKATRTDFIPARILKEAVPAIAPFLTYIFQQSIDTGNVSRERVTANITAIYKKGSKLDAANYGQVSLPSIPCKIQEHIIFHNIMAHLDWLQACQVNRAQKWSLRAVPVLKLKFYQESPKERFLDNYAYYCT